MNGAILSFVSLLHLHIMKKITESERNALAILAEVIGESFYLRDGELRMRGEEKTVRDMAARACGLVHRDGHLLTRMPAALQLRGHHPVSEDCLINSL